VPLLLVGGGIVAATGGVFFWLKRNHEIDSLDAICPERDACPPSRESEVNDARSRGKLYSAAGLGLMGLGVVSLAAGGYLLLDGGSSETRAALLPVVGPHVAGASLGASF